ncbi:cyclic-di-AMP receptor [Caldisalinibacter kiritimatiensis]|uniref:Protein from nitrogen regulatory protein P-II (GLNB) family n=1 Tax=Caldisalinibacter kiritimatiensis TaxID=1304284 RepID=R1AV62_9FIRM|nr:cyclic-di-AMP receptor [Caldisalinibacter kiritimatiensis]EOD01058.1 protein from nitrogen regulatory protein P-II (GLNB) family [Caldisalinibacter kiritimatiensis]
MKLIIAIVQDEDAPKLVESLMKNNFGVTKLASTGGFLRAGNTTLIIGVKKERLDEAIGIIKKLCKSRKRVTTSPAPNTWSAGVYMPYPVEVNVGGATIFVVDVEDFQKI